jgi:CBS domain-containing protein
MERAKDLMNTEVIVMRASDSVAEAIGLMRQKGLHHVIVKPRSDDDAYGIMTDADIAYKVIAANKNPRGVTVGEIMTKPCIVVNPDLGLEYVARLFANTHIHRAPVIQEELLGVISVSDIICKSTSWKK